MHAFNRDSIADFSILGVYILSLLVGITLLGLFNTEFNLFNFDILLFTISLTFLCNKFRKNRKCFEIGLTFDKTVIKNVITTLIFAFITFVFLYILLIVSDNLEYLPNSKNFDPNILTIYLVNVLIMVIIEELIFRSIGFQILEENLGGTFAIIFTSIIFTSVHLLNPNISIMGFINIFLAGILFGTMYYKSKSLFPMIIFHLIWNLSLSLIIGSKVSGANFPKLLYQMKYQDTNSFNRIFFGSSFGLEEGLVTTIILIILTIFTIIYFEESPLIMSGKYNREYTLTNLPKRRVNK
jgi:membrane protease YdiL (CAAX protease family)